MSTDFSPEVEGQLLRFVAPTVEITGGCVNSLHESMATKDEFKAQASAIREDIEQVQLRFDTTEHALAASLALPLPCAPLGQSHLTVPARPE